MPKSESSTVACIALAVLGFALAATRSMGQPNPLVQREVVLDIDSGSLESNLNIRGVIYSQQVHIEGARWIRLQFDEPKLGEAPAGGDPTILRITSSLDSAHQTMPAVHLQQWSNTTAYFNGDTVVVEIIADASAAPSRLKIKRAWAGIDDSSALQDGESICFDVDDRVLASEPANARLLPAGCTAWIISDSSNCLLTAGHCNTSSTTVAQFNVPLSDTDGTIVHPPPQDQYAIDPDSVQYQFAGTGNDWRYFGCFPNPMTNLTPFQAQLDAYVLADAAPPVGEQQIRITGYGKMNAPMPLTWNYAQTTHTGPYMLLIETVVRYQTDTTGGNSGSPVFDTSTGLCIGIHTEAGCWTTGGANQGTAIHHSGLQHALKHPAGVCVPQPPPCLSDVTADHQVNVGDLLEVVNAWGECAGCGADITRDNQVNVSDMLAVINAWGPCQ